MTLIFPSPFYPGKPLSDGTLNSALARLGYRGMCHRARISDAVFHVCQRSWLELGRNREAVVA